MSGLLLTVIILISEHKSNAINKENYDCLGKTNDLAISLSSFLLDTRTYSKNLFISRPEQLKSEDLTKNPAFIVPVVLLCAALLIILAVVFFIKIKK